MTETLSSPKSTSTHSSLQRQLSKKHRHATKVTDDGIHSYFYRAHTAIVLIIVLSALAYTTFFEDHTIHEHDWEYNTKRGISWACFVFIAFGITQARDGPFMRPHPAIWRLVLCTSVLYLLFMVFLLFQSASNARNLMKYFDPEIGEPLNFTSYGHDCDIYDKNNPEDPFHNVKHKMDGFVAAHIIGWTMKTVMMRDFWLANIISILFELCEYSLEHQLANFSECWWDHWIMDFLVCNLSGIFIGMWIVRYLEGKEYNWRGLYKHPTTRGKVSRIIGQFSPHSWVSFQWNVTQSLKNFLLIMLIIVLYLLTEINTFYLKYVLWIPAGHAIVLIRLQIFILWGAVSTREIYDWSVGEANTIGQQFWVYSSCLFCECLIIYKFGYETLKQPFPDHIRQGWTWFFGLLIVYMIYKFQIRAGHVKPGSVEEKEAIKAGELDPKATVRLGLSESPASSDNGREKLRQRKKQSSFRGKSLSSYKTPIKSKTADQKSLNSTTKPSSASNTPSRVSTPIHPFGSKSSCSNSDTALFSNIPASPICNLNNGGEIDTPVKSQNLPLSNSISHPNHLLSSKPPLGPQNQKLQPGTPLTPDMESFTITPNHRINSRHNLSRNDSYTSEHSQSQSISISLESEKILKNSNSSFLPIFASKTTTSCTDNRHEDGLTNDFQESATNSLAGSAPTNTNFNPENEKKSVTKHNQTTKNRAISAFAVTESNYQHEPPLDLTLCLADLSYSQKRKHVFKVISNDGSEYHFVPDAKRL